MPSKRQAREELQKLVENFTGEITRRSEDSKITITCKCGYRRYVSFGYFVQFKPRCKCGGDMQVRW